LLRRLLAREISVGKAPEKGSLSLAGMRGLDDRLLCSHFVSIAEVDKRRLIHALHGRELLKNAEDLTAEKQERRKLIHRLQAVEAVAGSLCVSKGSTCRWKAPRIREAVLVDVRAVEGVLTFCKCPVRRAGAGRDKGVRGRIAGSPAVENTVAEQRCQQAALVCSSDTKRDACGSSEAGGRRQTLYHLGSGCRKVVRRRAPNGSTRNRRSHRGGGYRCRTMLGNRAMFGCSE
jgi:hypothetical protein